LSVEADIRGRQQAVDSAVFSTHTELVSMCANAVGIAC
jgi:hypothetical protein